ncbi:hypothetical protein GCM10010331_68970 [Streptomyces xanthochromogenes]|nr:hypothetical protein GCM10010331_68970 [Streptomyces xanthochromogenes]
MTSQSEGSSTTRKADRLYNWFRWLGPIYSIYKIVWDLLG